MEDASIQVEKAIGEVIRANNNGLSYKDLSAVISKTALKYSLPESLIRAIGGWNLKKSTVIKLIKAI